MISSSLLSQLLITISTKVLVLWYRSSVVYSAGDIAFLPVNLYLLRHSYLPQYAKDAMYVRICTITRELLFSALL